MKTVFISSKSREKLNKNYFLESLRNLPKNIALFYSIQYEEIAKEAKILLEKNNKITKFSQILGCSNPTIPKETQAILLLGSGKFHALSIATTSNLPIYIYEHSNLKKLSEKELIPFNQHRNGAYAKFLSSKRVGILISTKPGQQNLKRALKLKDNLKEKKVYLFLGDLLFSNEFENFGLNSWINTACPRMDMENTSIINISELENLQKD